MNFSDWLKLKETGTTAAAVAGSSATTTADIAQVKLPIGMKPKPKKKKLSEGEGYGSCPVCGAEGVSRERCPCGNTTCEKGHVTPSKEWR